MFQTHLLSVDNLGKIIHPSQLTQDFEGTLPYDHEEWVEIRIVSSFNTFTSTCSQIQSSLHLFCMQLFAWYISKQDKKN